jgi:hypothetical protein
MFKYIQPGWDAARKNFIPGLFIQGLMAALVVSYYFCPQFKNALAGLMKLKKDGGYLFTFISSGCGAGICAEICNVYFLQKGIWTKTNFYDLRFKFLLFGFGGITVDLLYHLQSAIFGDQLDLSVVIKKVLLDQFVFTPLWGVPYMIIMFYWREQKFAPSKLRFAFKLSFYKQEILPMLVSCWMFWFPMVTLIYCMPFLLQIPMSVLANTLWGLMVISLMRPQKGIRTEA